MNSPVFGKTLLIAIGLLLTAIHWNAQAAQARTAASSGAEAAPYDVLIVGGSSSGIGAAIGAARAGARVLLVEDTPVLGGMLSNGISNIDSYSYESLSGVFEEFRLAVKAHYAAARPGDPFFQPRPRNIRHLDGRSFAAHEASEGGRWEPHVAQRIFRSMAERHRNLHILYSSRLTGVRTQAGRILSVTVETPAGTSTLSAKVFVDATHEGDLAAWAGVPYRIGREPRSAEEPHAGHILYFNATGEILPGSTGRGDMAIPSAGLRLCIQQYPPEAGDRHVLKSPPPGYDPSKYQLAPASLSTSVPGGKFEMNVNPVGNELQQINWEWPEATHERRRELYEQYKNHALGFLYDLQHVKGQKHYGLPRDEFLENGFVPWRVFLREGRRIEGEATMTERDVNPFLSPDPLRTPFRADSIAVGHYPIDAKPVRPKTDASTPDKGEGDFYLINASAPFQVPYGAMLPKNVTNLLVPTALSATHVAFSAVRMDPTWTVLGQASGVAAALAAKRDGPPREVPLATLQQALLNQKLRLVFYWDLPLEHPAFHAIQMLSLRGVMDGFPDRTVRPDAPLTRAQMASILTRAYRLWPSVSDWHFQDVPPAHWAFQAVETLHDQGILTALGIPARWPEAGGYAPNKHWGFDKPSERRTFTPDQPVHWGEFLSALRAAMPSVPASLPAAKAATDTVHRGEAALFLLPFTQKPGVQP